MSSGNARRPSSAVPTGRIGHHRSVREDARAWEPQRRRAGTGGRQRRNGRTHAGRGEVCASLSVEVCVRLASVVRWGPAAREHGRRRRRPPSRGRRPCAGPRPGASTAAQPGLPAHCTDAAGPEPPQRGAPPTSRATGIARRSDGTAGDGRGAGDPEGVHGESGSESGRAPCRCSPATTAPLEASVRRVGDDVHRVVTRVADGVHHRHCAGRQVDVQRAEDGVRREPGGQQGDRVAPAAMSAVAYSPLAMSWKTT